MAVSRNTRRRNSLSHHHHALSPPSRLHNNNNNDDDDDDDDDDSHPTSLMTITTTTTSPRYSSSSSSSYAWRGVWQILLIIVMTWMVHHLVVVFPSWWNRVGSTNENDLQTGLLLTISKPSQPNIDLHPNQHPLDTLKHSKKHKNPSDAPIQVTKDAGNNVDNTNSNVPMLLTSSLLRRPIKEPQLLQAFTPSTVLPLPAAHAGKTKDQPSPTPPQHPTPTKVLPKRYYHTVTTVDHVTILFSTTAATTTTTKTTDASSTTTHQDAWSNMDLLFASTSRSHAIVYLVQKTHSTYQRDSFGLLLQSLDLLFQHYFATTASTDASADAAHQHHDVANTTNYDATTRSSSINMTLDKLNRTDIYLFHTGDFTQDDLTFLEDRYYARFHSMGVDDDDHTDEDSVVVLGRPYAGMFRLADLSRSKKYWQVPKSMRKENVSTWFRYPQFSVGYRHMCSWFAIGIWEFFDKLNHFATTATTATTKSTLSHQPDHSSTTTTAVAAAVLFNYTYIWRLDEDSFLLSPIRYNLFDYMQQHDFVYGYRLCSYELDYNYYMKPWFEKWHAKTRPRRPIVLENAGMCAFYNNFFIAQLAWFRQAHVQQFLKHMRPKIYRMRYGDLLLHTMALYAYADHGNGTSTEFNKNDIGGTNTSGSKIDIHRFLDFTYQHITYNTTTQCVLYGGIQAGYNDPRATQTLHDFYQHQHPLQQRPACSEPVQRFRLTAQDLSPTYQHVVPANINVHNKHPSNVTLETIVVGRMEIPGKGILSG